MFVAERLTKTCTQTRTTSTMSHPDSKQIQNAGLGLITLTGMGLLYPNRKSKLSLPASSPPTASADQKSPTQLTA